MQRASFGLQSFLAAAHFSRQAHDLERASRDLAAKPLTEHRTYVLSAVVMAAVGLEGVINEFLSAADDHFIDDLCGLGGAQRQLLALFWEVSHDKASILGKYQGALRLLGTEQFDRGCAPYQSAKDLVDLRNDIAHYKPSWQGPDGSAATGELHEWEKRLRGRFPECPLVGEGNPFFPDKLLGHGCAYSGAT